MRSLPAGAMAATVALLLEKASMAPTISPVTRFSPSRDSASRKAECGTVGASTS